MNTPVATGFITMPVNIAYSEAVGMMSSGALVGGDLRGQLIA